MYPQGSSQDKILGVYVYAGIHHPADKNIIIVTSVPGLGFQ